MGPATYNPQSQRRQAGYGCIFSCYHNCPQSPTVPKSPSLHDSPHYQCCMLSSPPEAGIMLSTQISQGEQDGCLCGGQLGLTCLCSDAKELCPNQPLSRVVFLGCTPVCEEGISVQGQSLSLRVTGATQMLAKDTTESHLLQC